MDLHGLTIADPILVPNMTSRKRTHTNFQGTALYELMGVEIGTYGTTGTVSIKPKDSVQDADLDPYVIGPPQSGFRSSGSRSGS